MFITSGAAAKIQLQFLTEKIKLICDRFWNLYITRRPHHDKYRDFLQHFSAKLQQHSIYFNISLENIPLRFGLLLQGKCISSTQGPPLLVVLTGPGDTKVAMMEYAIPGWWSRLLEASSSPSCSRDIPNLCHIKTHTTTSLCLIEEGRPLYLD